MEDEKFKEFLMAVKGDGDDEATWERRELEVKRHIRELIETEFQSISMNKKKILVSITNKLREKALGSARMQAKVADQDYGIVYINRSNWKKAEFDDSMLRQIIRHELLHIETGLGDSSPTFQRIARANGIPLSPY